MSRGEEFRRCREQCEHKCGVTGVNACPGPSKETDWQGMWIPGNEAVRDRAREVGRGSFVEAPRA